VNPSSRAAHGLPALRLSRISKRFGALLANDDISLDVQRGEVLALLGENGAGKSTLVSILFGHYAADAGTVAVEGHALPPGDTRAALAAGVGMVHQHFTLADNLSVLDNVMLGAEPLWRLASGRRAARAQLLQTAERFGLQVEPDARVAGLSVGERQRVELLKALTPVGTRRGARILVLDEPTAVLTPQEVQSLFATLRRMVAQGLAVIFISHKLDEVLAVAHRVAVLRSGRLVADTPVAGTDQAMLAQAMVGRDVPPPAKREHTLGGVVLSLQGATVRGSGSRALLQGVDLSVRSGEIVAIAGVAGNGQQALAQVLGGGRAPDEGRVALQGRAMPAAPRAWVAAGVARVPEDRHAEGVVGDMALWENAVLERYAQVPFARLGVLRRARAIAQARSLVERFDVRAAAGTATVTRSLSGGNMQKLILARVLAHAPALIVASQPTWGLDVGAVAFVHQQLLDAAARGAAVLLISEELDEIFALADRISVLHQGRLTPARATSHWSLAEIGLAMAGQATPAADAAHAA
jgi:general nucleoside transport system ATP-binding protein